MKPRIGIIPGDPGGIGPEIIAKLLAEDEVRDQADILLIGDRHLFEMGQAQAGVEIEMTDCDARTGDWTEIAGLAIHNRETIAADDVRLAEVTLARYSPACPARACPARVLHGMHASACCAIRAAHCIANVSARGACVVGACTECLRGVHQACASADPRTAAAGWCACSSRVGLTEVVHTRVASSGARPGVTTKEVLDRDEKTVSLFNPPLRAPTQIEARKMFAVALESLVLASMNNHIYSFAGEFRKQSKGGAIGNVLTGSLGAFAMVIWSRGFKKNLNYAMTELESFKHFLLKIYVDDGNQICSTLPPGSRLINGKLRILEEKVEETLLLCPRR